jgi:signal transduction histidine kinase
MLRLVTAAVVPLLAAVTWLAVQGMDPEASRFDSVLGALERFEGTESALRRNVLGARAGLVHNYDPIVRESNALREAVRRLREAHVDPVVLGPLSDLVEQQEQLIERFKSDNAVLQESLSYFALLSSELATSDREVPVVAAVSALAGAMLNLAVDRSPRAAEEVAARIHDLDQQEWPVQKREAVDALLAHGRLLQNLLPETDNVVRTIYNLPRMQRQDTVRASILAEQKQSREIARQYRLALSGVSLLLLIAFGYLGQQVRRRAMLHVRRARFEHTIARISMRFINSHPSETPLLVERALAELAMWVNADRAYFVGSDAKGARHVWSNHGVEFPADWPEEAFTLVARHERRNRMIYITDMDRYPAGPDRDILLEMGLRGWACVARAEGAVGWNILGFDAVRGLLSTYSDEAPLLRIAFDVVANAINRDTLWLERARLENSLRRARRMETVGALTSGIAHNFNNIVGTILGYTEMAETQAPRGPTEGYLQAIRQAGARASQLIDQILAFGRVREAVGVPVSLQHLLHETASMLRVVMPEGARLRVDPIPEEAVVSGEATQLQQVLINLCNNAVHAMHGAGTVRVTVTVHRISKGRTLSHGHLSARAYVCIGIRDSGHGISASTQERLFEPFFTTREAGNGLGLAMVRTIVREHSGGLNVESALGEGSLFEVWLPQAEASVPILDGPEAPSVSRGQGEAILLLNDDPDHLLRDEEIIAALGYEVIGFTAVEDAVLACLREPGRFDAVVISHSSRLSSALDLSARLRETAPHLPVLLAAAADALDSDALASAGVSELIAGPITSAAFASALRRSATVRHAAMGGIADFIGRV